MLKTTRLSLLMCMAVVGVLASLSEANAGRRCRRASACPCPCPQVVTSVPEVLFSEALRANPVVSGTCYDQGNPPVVSTSNITITVWAKTSGSGGNFVILWTYTTSNGLYNSSTNGTWSGLAPIDQQFYISFTRSAYLGSSSLATPPAGSTGPLAWGATTEKINPVVPLQ